MKRPIGRPRDLQSREAILVATMQLLDRVAVGELAIEAVAREARVSKATIYRWWASRAALVIDAFMASHVSNTPMPAGLDPRSALASHLTSLATYFRGRAGKLVVQIVSEGQSDPQLLGLFHDCFVENRRKLVQSVFEDGQRGGIFRTDIAARWAVEALYAPIYRRLMFGMPLDDSFVTDLTRALDLYCLVRPGIVRSKPKPRAAERTVRP